MNVMGRVKPGVPDATAQAALDGQLNAVVRATMPVRPNEDIPKVDLRDGSRGMFTQQRTFAKPMTVLLTMVGFVLLLACANIANLMLARGTQRQREVSVRLALGATRREVLRMVLRESILLALVGIGIGLPVAFAVARTLRSMLFGLSSADPSAWVAALCGIALVTLAAAVLPALRAASIEPIQAPRSE